MALKFFCHHRVFQTSYEQCPVPNNIIKPFIFWLKITQVFFWVWGGVPVAPRGVFGFLVDNHSLFRFCEAAVVS